MDSDASQRLLRASPPPWLLNHPELVSNALALADGNIAELIHLSLQTALKEQPKPYSAPLTK